MCNWVLQILSAVAWVTYVIPYCDVMILLLLFDSNNQDN
jgi:hypothetical protein